MEIIQLLLLVKQDPSLQHLQGQLLLVGIVTEVIFFPNFPSISSVITWVTSINHETIVQVSGTWANVWTLLASVLVCVTVNRKVKS